MSTRTNFSANVDSNGTVVFGYLDSQDLDVEMVRLYSDSDRDLVFDRIDAMPHVGEQWNDQDSDGFGDNPTGPLSDDCPRIQEYHSTTFKAVMIMITTDLEMILIHAT